MAFGESQGGGVLSYPLVPEAGVADWAQMSGVSPHHPLVGGSAGHPGYEGGQRSVAIAAPDPQQGVAEGSPMRSHWSELFNFKGNPIGWVLIAALLYLGVTALHVNASGGIDARVGRKR